MRVPEQVQRIATVTAVVVVVVLALRFLILPRTLFSTAFHQAKAVARETALPVSYGGVQLCRECHEDVNEVRARSYHRNLACETCHGPSAGHADDPMNVKPYAPRDRKFCPVCHAYDAARPTGFPQINPVTHNQGAPCIACHNPHDPTPPETPRECSACHAQIWNTKAVSAHAALHCTTCHETPDQHKVSPRSVRPTKPETRDFCGRCHGSAATEPGAPKIDLATHNSRYLCWQCHYPHLPEGR